MLVRSITFLWLIKCLIVQHGTWSQKNNLIGDQVVRLHLFADSVLRKELAYYPKVMDRYGLPSDNRKAQAAPPWSFWAASLTRDDADFHRLFHPIFDYVNTTRSRPPFVDLSQPETANAEDFHARLVLSGIFIKTVLDQPVWHKWTNRDMGIPGDWAPTPIPLQVRGFTGQNQNN